MSPTFEAFDLVSDTTTLAALHGAAHVVDINRRHTAVRSACGPRFRIILQHNVIEWIGCVALPPLRRHAQHGENGKSTAHYADC